MYLASNPQVATGSPPSTKLQRFIIEHLSINARKSGNIASWAHAGLITPSISAYVDTELIPKWLRTRFNGLWKLSIHLQIFSALLCSLEEFDTSVSYHPSLCQIHLHSQFNIWERDNIGDSRWFPWLKEFGSQHLPIFQLKSAAFESNVEGKWDMYHGVYWTKLLTMLKFDKICRNLQESEGICRNWRESAGISGNQRESEGICRNQQEQAGMYRFHYFVILQSIRNERECKYRNIFDFILPNPAVLACS